MARYRDKNEIKQANDTETSLFLWPILGTACSVQFKWMMTLSARAEWFLWRDEWELLTSGIWDEQKCGWAYTTNKSYQDWCWMDRESFIRVTRLYNELPYVLVVVCAGERERVSHTFTSRALFNLVPIRMRWQKWSIRTSLCYDFRSAS